MLVLTCIIARVHARPLLSECISIPFFIPAGTQAKMESERVLASISRERATEAAGRGNGM